MTRGDFHDGSEKGIASVHQILCQSWEKCYGLPGSVPKMEETLGPVPTCGKELLRG